MTNDGKPKALSIRDASLVLIGSPEHANALVAGRDPVGEQNTDIYKRMEALVFVMNAISDDLKKLQPMAPRTLHLIKQMKNTATDIEMEVVERRGY